MPIAPAYGHGGVPDLGQQYFVDLDRVATTLRHGVDVSGWHVEAGLDQAQRLTADL